jgi:hypothetical protein
LLAERRQVRERFEEMICGAGDRDRVLPNGSLLIRSDDVYFDNLLQYFRKLVVKSRRIIFFFRSEQKKLPPEGTVKAVKQLQVHGKEYISQWHDSDQTGDSECNPPLFVPG